LTYSSERNICFQLTLLLNSPVQREMRASFFAHSSLGAIFARGTPSALPGSGTGSVPPFFV
jgi:hypothetical protein